MEKIAAERCEILSAETQVITIALGAERQVGSPRCKWLNASFTSPFEASTAADLKKAVRVPLPQHGQLKISACSLRLRYGSKFEG